MRRLERGREREGERERERGREKEGQGEGIDELRKWGQNPSEHYLYKTRLQKYYYKDAKLRERERKRERR